MVRPKLVAHFMCNKIDIERVADGGAASRDTMRFPIAEANRSQDCHAAAGGGENMTNIVIGRSDNGVNIGLVLAQERSTIVVGIGIFDSVGVYQ